MGVRIAAALLVLMVLSSCVSVPTRDELAPNKGVTPENEDNIA